MKFIIYLLNCRYQRFSDHRGYCERFCKRPGVGSSIILLSLLFALSIGTWWLVCWIIGSAWGDEHYRRLWERAHPDDPLGHAPAAPIIPYPHEKVKYLRIIYLHKFRNKF